MMVAMEIVSVSIGKTYGLCGHGKTRVVWSGSAICQHLIGNHCDCLIPSRPPAEAIRRRRQDAKARFRGQDVPSIPQASPAGKRTKSRKKPSRIKQTLGYRPGRKGKRSNRKD